MLPLSFFNTLSTIGLSGPDPLLTLACDNMPGEQPFTMAIMGFVMYFLANTETWRSSVGEPVGIAQ